ncbi:MAG: glycine betaine/L-proline ABC transporter ATP-binding protein [Desulforegulaceae bacterium]|nr:glycine betaine/L-proline ABC transporter ATP-binding protein [Desulforegulaceae bacterium]
MSKIQIKEVYKIFGPNPKKAIKLLKDGMTKDELLDKTKHSVGVGGVSFDVKEGEILVVMGLSGSGKSTLVRCINRLIEPSDGQILIDGVDIGKVDDKELRKIRQEKFGMVFQHFALFPHRTVAQNAEYGLEIKGVDPEKRRQRAIEVLEQVGLKGHEESYPSQLSGGMQQRVGLARALALDPDILLMDEAFSALDPLIRSDMQDELIDLQDKVKKTIVFISHDLDEALKLGDRIVLMKDGKVVQIGTPEDILMNPASRYVEKFVEDVNITKILTAQHVMNKVKATAHMRNDGPRAALRKMKNNNFSKLFITSQDNTLVGMVTAEKASEALKRGDKDLTKIIEKDIITVTPDTQASELFEILHDLPYPLGVVDENKKLKGVIIRGTLLAALAEGGN